MGTLHVYHRRTMVDDTLARIRGLPDSMPPQLQLAIRLLSTPSSELAGIAAGVKGVVASDTGDDLLARVVEDDDSAWRFHELPAHVTGDVWVDGNPPVALANRRVLPQLGFAPDATTDDLRNAQWFLRSLGRRASTFERIVGELARARPTLATALTPIDVDPVPVRALVEAAGLHESTIERAVRACRVENRHRVFALAIVNSAIRLAD